MSTAGHLSRGLLFDLASSELGSSEASVSLALDVMVRRAKNLGKTYPFVVNELAVLRTNSSWAEVYACLLHLTPGSIARQTIRHSETPLMGALLEEVSEVALANFWGHGGEALAFGYPSKHGRPKEFSLAVPWVAEKIGLSVGMGYRPPRRKDGGVDVIAWRQFADRRPGFPIALAQCTIQSEAFTKTSDIDLRLWASWLATDVDPLSLLVLPGTIRASGPEWGQLTTVVTVIDRIRVMELLQRGCDPPAVGGWVTETTNGLRPLMKASEW
ncbi:hypothetical protein [Janibacter sp. UYMM211]|uniref:hypothetical protein n=1 Tax=Janibacter sp. UYMM211 TaxID=3156342 RepID=UPI003397E0DF